MKLYASLIGRLDNQHQTIDNILSTIDFNRMQMRPQPNKWNICDNVAHLVRYQFVFTERINQILIKDCPEFGRYKAEEDPEFEKWRVLDIADLFKQLKQERQNIYSLITSLSDSEINRPGVHKKFGKLNIIQWTEFFLLHEAHHIFTIFQLAHDTEL